MLCPALFPSQVRFEWIDDPYELPDAIIPYRDSLIKHHRSQSRVFDSETLRVNKWTGTDNELVLHLSPTTYFDTLITNRSLEIEVSPGKTVRDLLAPKGDLSPLNNTLLSNHLGTTVFVKVENSIVFTQRNGAVSVGKNALGSSVTGAVKGEYALESGYLKPNGVRDAVEAEVLDETGYKASLESNWVKAIFFDPREGYKPNLFSEIVFPGSQEEFRSVFQNNPAPNTDGEEVLFIETEDLVLSEVREGVLYTSPRQRFTLSSTTAEAVGVWQLLNSPILANRDRQRGWLTTLEESEDTSSKKCGSMF